MTSSEGLLKYFLFGIYNYHLNKQSVYGSKGKLAIAYGDFMTEMYVGESRYLSPWDIKRIISQKAN